MVNTLIHESVESDPQAGEKSAILRSALEHARRNPNAVAFRDLGDGDSERATISFGDFVKNAATFGDHLADARKSSRNGSAPLAVLQFSPGPDYITALFGCWWAGITAVPAYLPRSSRHLERLAAILRDCQPDFVLTAPGQTDRVGEISRSAAPEAELIEFAISNSTSRRSLPTSLPEFGSDNRNETALIQYTSGSTGSPKGVVVTHANLLHNVDAILAGLPNTPTVSVSWLPPYHDMGLISKILLPVHSGIEAVLLSPFGFMQRPFRWLKAISDYRGSFSGAPDSAYDLCCRRITGEERRQLDLSSWEVAFNGSEPVRGCTLKRFRGHFQTCGFRPRAVWPVYGLAEATLCVTQPEAPGLSRTAVRKNDGREFVSCGRPVKDMRVEIVRRGSNPPTTAAEREEGEIWISGPSVTNGYYHQQQATVQAFHRSLAKDPDRLYLRTGDLGFMLDGELFVTGRVKNVLIFNGQNYHPEDIERTAEHSHPALHVGGTAAFACEDAAGRKQLALALEVPHRETQDYAGIVRDAREAIGSQFDLRAAVVICVRDWRLPRTTSGKIQRQTCARLLESGWQGALCIDDQRVSPAAASAHTSAPPQMLETVRAAMADVFGLPSIEPDADFFNLGGHSLTATRVASRLSAALKVTIPIRLIFEAPTPNDLATKIASEFESLKREQDETPTAANDISILTPSQRRMWFLHITDPASSAYNVSGALGVNGEFDATTAVAAFRMCLKAHPILRATYATENGLPVQRIASVDDIDLGGIVRDYREADDAGARINDEATRLTKLPFDLSTGPLYRFRVFQLSDDSHVLAVSFHHIVIDGWAVGILIRDLFKYYAQLREGGHLDIVPVIADIPSVQAASPAKLKSQLDYWKTTLKGTQDSLDLPVDHATPRTGVSDGSLCKIPLDPVLLSGLQDTAKSHRSTVFMVMLAGFQVLLARYSRQRDFLIGVPVANRNQKETENVIASMVNTLPYRADMNDDPTLPELLARVRNTVLDMQDNQDAPLEAILDAMDRTGSIGSSPFRVMFDYQEIPLPQNDSLVLDTEQWETHRGAAQFDLSLFVSDINGDYFAALEYRPSLFDASTIAQMSNHFISILHCMLQAHSAHQNHTVFTMPLLSRKERRRILTSGNDTALALAPGGNLLHDISRQVIRHANAVAISSTDGELTYAQVDQTSNRIARHLQAEGIGRGDSVAVYLERSAEMVSVLLGILKSGACYVPLDPEYPAERIAMILEDAAPRAAVTQSHIAGNIAGTPTFLLDDAKLRTKLGFYSDAPVENTISPDDLAYIIFTSGSTGRPKGVEIPHRGLHNFLHSMAAEPGLAEGDTLLAVTTVSFDISGLEMFLPLLCGARVHIARRDEALDGHHLIDALESLDVTHLQATPATWQLLLTCGWKGKQSGRPLKMLCGGEELPRELAAQLIACGEELWNLYGPTETTIWSTARRITSADSISIGRPIGNTQCYVLDDHLEPVPTGVSGELFIGGDGVAAGYHKRPDLTAERFVPDPFANNGARMYRTGDLARYDSSGELQYLGRLDHQVKIRGHRIELGEIATALDSHPSVRRSVVTASELPGLGKSLVAYCEPADSNIATNTLLDHVRKVLPAYMVPTAVVIMDALPQTPSGKIDRKQLPLPQASTSTDYAAPKNELERRMTEIWADLLRLPKVGTNDDFFALGGHSLLAAQAFIRMKEELGIDLPLNALFDRATVSALAERWEQGRSETNDLPKGVEILHAPTQETTESSVTLLWVHPLGGGGGGGLLSYREMAKGLPAVCSFGIREAGEKFDTLEQMAQKYAERLCQTVPAGSVALAGFCFGGNLALEVARQMKAMGRDVKDVFLLDAQPGSGSVQKRGRLQGAIERFVKGTADDRQRLATRVARKVQHRLTGLIVGSEISSYIPDLEEILDLKDYPETYRDIARHHWILLQKHSLAEYTGPALLMQSTPEHAVRDAHSSAWSPFVPGIVVETIQGTHEDFLRSAEMMQRVSELISDRLTPLERK